MSRTGRTLALLGAAALLVSAFLPWVGTGDTALDLGLTSWGDRLAQPTVALALVVLAALPAVAALVGDRGWPRAVAGALGGALVIAWLAWGPDGELTSGVLWAVGGAATLLLAAAFARPRTRAGRYPTPPQTTDVPPRPPPPTDADGWDAGAPRREVGPPPPAAPPTDGSPTGYRVVPFTPQPTIEAWGPTRASCFAQALEGALGTVLDPELVGGAPSDPQPAATPDEPVPPDRPDGSATGHVAIRLEGADDRATLARLLAQGLNQLRDGRVPRGIDLFDGPDGQLLGYLTTVALPGTHDLGGLATTPVRVDVERDGDRWSAHVELEGS